MLLLRISVRCLRLMITRGQSRLLFFLKLWIFTCLLSASIGGCGWLSTCSVICRDELVKQGQDAYLNEDYTLARQVFHDLALREDDIDLQAAGCYGMLCLDMTLAENAPAFRKAAEQFFLLPSRQNYAPPVDGIQVPGAQENWPGPEFPFLHPAMLVRAMAHGTVLLESERDGILEKLNALFAKEKVYIKERSNMQSAIENLKQEIADLKAMVLSGQEEITALKHQITTLENIDRQQQEQRKNK